MKIAVTLDDDVALRLMSQAARTGESVESLINDTLRTGLDAARRRPQVDGFHYHAAVQNSPFDASGLDELAQALSRASRSQAEVN